ncbi:MAG: ABC transporter substrate binding protein [Kiloniellales bacterium]|nr:ABC transporter substrate binding protein [Kiloniellales bacterium]
MGKKILLGLLIPIVLAAGGFYLWQGGNFGKKRVLFIDSYHKGYAWSDGITTGIVRVLASHDVELHVHRMDTKNNKGEDFKKRAGLRAKQVIDRMKPDVVIAADDNAQKYLIVPYFRGSDLPVVFAGVNWDASGYGYPASNVTGMVEVEAPDHLFDILRRFSNGTRLGSLGTNSETNRKVVQKYGQLLNIYFQEDVYVDTFEEWKQAYLDLQNKVDILFMYNNAGIEGWNDAEAVAFVQENSRIPSGSVQPWMAPFVMVSYSKDATEQGEWAAEAALRILDGDSPNRIPIARNQRGEMMVNSAIANRLGVEVPPEMLSRASRVIN